MTVVDNFLPEPVFKILQNYCDANDFEIVQAGDKAYSVLQTPDLILPFLKIEGYELILSFIRSAKKDFDTDARIHADNIIQGLKTNIATVLYINEDEGVSKNGTAFWKHHKYGLELPKNVSDEEFNRLLTEDSNDLSKWEHQVTVFSKPNRQLLYNSNLFHSKYPKVIEEGVRKVLVCFYSEKNKI